MLKTISLGLLLIVFPAMIQGMTARYPSEEKQQTSSLQITPPTITNLYTLKIPVSGTNQSVDETIDLQKITDSIALSTLAELLTESLKEKRTFILARITTKIDDKYSVEYYSLENINLALFKDLYPDLKQKTERYNFLTPLRARITGEINYFLFNPITKQFEYLATDTDLYTIVQKTTAKEKLSAGQNFIINIVNTLYSDTSIHAHAYQKIGRHYNKQKHYESAREWYIKAIQLGHIGAMVNLGFMDENGEGLPAPNYQSAREWFIKAAQLGNSDAMFRLGVMDAKGEGLSAPNYQSARAWYQKALTANPSLKSTIKIHLSEIEALEQKSKRKISESQGSEPSPASSEQPPAKKQK